MIYDKFYRYNKKIQEKDKCFSGQALCGVDCLEFSPQPWTPLYRRMSVTKGPVDRLLNGRAATRHFGGSGIHALNPDDQIPARQCSLDERESDIGRKKIIDRSVGFIFQPYNSSNIYLSKKPTNYGQAQKPCMLETIQPLEVCV